MKKIILILLVAWGQPGWAQHTDPQFFSPRTTLTLALGIQKDDNRLPNASPIVNNNLNRDDNWLLPTLQLSLSVERTLLTNRNFSLSLGLGLTQEMNNFPRLINKRYLFPQSVGRVAVYVNRYKVDQVTGLLDFKHRLTYWSGRGLLYVGLQMRPGFHFRKSNIPRVYTRWIWGFYSLEVNPGLGLRRGPWDIMLHYRAFQYKQIDPVLFYGPGPPAIDGVAPYGYETHNTFKLWLSLSYDLGTGRLFGSRED